MHVSEIRLVDEYKFHLIHLFLKICLVCRFVCMTLYNSIGGKFAKTKQRRQQRLHTQFERESARAILRFTHVHCAQ